MANVQPVRADKKPKLRDRDFTKAEREAILAAARSRPGADCRRNGVLLAVGCRWLCAYSGARVNEITQLRAEDVKQIEGVWTIRITPEAGRVKTNAARVVPPSRASVGAGLLDIADRRDGPLFFDPASSRGGTEGRQHKKVGMFLAAWVREEVGLTDPNVAPNHGWRHTFKTICRGAEIDEGAADCLQWPCP